jgi:tricorn protease
MVRTALLFLLVIGFSAQANVGYYQHPTHDGRQLVFSAQGDLWLASLEGGVAQRLTAHPELETHPVLSLDGEWIAFMGNYDEGRELYVMPTAGGAPRRLTFNGSVFGIEGWTAEGKILYVSGIRPDLHIHIRSIDPVDLIETEWPLAAANQASEGKDGQVFFTRFGLHLTGDHSKQYRGGAMAQLWTYQPGENEASRLLTDLDANARRPMWARDRLYFLSDRSGDFNIWSVDGGGRDLTQHTRHQGWDVRHPEARGDSMVYQLGADLYRLDLTTDRNEPIDLQLRSDFDNRRQRWLANPLDYATSITLAPEGDRVAVTARGRVALIGLAGERRVTLPLPAEQRGRSAILGSDGEWAYVIAASDEFDEILRYAADGSGKHEQITSDGSIYRWRMVASPDGRHLVHSDKRGDLWLLNLQTGKNQRIDQLGEGDDPYADISWSKDGQLLTYTRYSSQARLTQVVLREVESGRSQRLTTDRFPSHSPTFSSDRKFLYFISDRSFNATPGAPWGDRNLGPMFDRRSKVYALALDPGAVFPFLPKALRSDSSDEKTDEKEKAQDDDDVDAEPATLVWDGLDQRLYESPIAPGNYARLEASEQHLFLIDAPLHGEPQLKSIEISEQAKTETFAESVADYDLSVDGKKLYYRVENNAYIVPAGAKPPEDLTDHTIALEDWKLAITPEREWQQMFDDAWRMHRDFAFDRDLRGVDWTAVRAKYRPLVERVTHRYELDDLLGEMISELGILHSQVRGSELAEDDEQPVSATLGGEYSVVDSGLKITRILQGDPDLPQERAPLARPEADVRVGDVITAINHQQVRNPADLARVLDNQAGQPVVLELLRDKKPAHQTTVLPVPASELFARRYRDWEQRKRAEVEEAGQGEIGYLHLYAMGSRDIADFAREFYALVRRDGLIIDVRRNRGGNIDSWVINALTRQVWAFWHTADSDQSVFDNMQQAYRGHVVVLIDEFTYSDGESFAAGIKALDVAPLIGKRTTGAGIWLSGRNRLSDNGVARIAEYAQYSLDGSWLIEGHGVSPDIEVDNLPHASYQGQDAQLARAVSELKRRIREQPIPVLRGEAIPPVGVPGSDVD